MIEVHIRSARPDVEPGALVTIRADGDRLEIAPARPGELARRLCEATVARPVIDAFGHRHSPDENPEAWARSLPYALRAQDYTAAIVHDDSPVTLPPQRPAPAIGKLPIPAYGPRAGAGRSRQDRPKP